MSGSPFVWLVLLAIADMLPPAAVIASESDRFPAAARARLVYLYLMVEEGVPHTRKAVEDWLDERRADAVYLDRIAMGGLTNKCSDGCSNIPRPMGGILSDSWTRPPTPTSWCVRR